MNSLENLVPTQTAAAALGLKRQQFLSLARFLGVKPMGQQRLGKASRTPANMYSSEDLVLLKALEAHCQVSGTRAVLKHLLESRE